MSPPPTSHPASTDPSVSRSLRTAAIGKARSSSPHWQAPSSTSSSPRPSSTIRKENAAMADTTYTTRTAQAPLAEAGTLADLRVSPAAHLAEVMAAASAAGGREVALRELPFAVQLGLRAQPDTASAHALEDVFGVPLPRRVGQVTGDEAGLHMLWLGPDEFLAVD